MDTAEKRPTILIVDDNPTNLGVIVDYLERHDFHVIIARDGETAIKRAKFVQPDIILLDIMMPPGINGFETCRRLKADEATEEIPVIFMTALARVEDKVEGFAVGAVDYITKPIQQEEVLARITTHLTIQSQKEQLEQMADTLQVKNKQLAELIASKDKFFAIIAHDLRSPFNTLIGYSQLLLLHEKIYSKEDILEMVGDINEAARNTYELLQNLLNWASIHKGYMSYEPQANSLNEIVERNIQLVSSIAKHKKIEVSEELNAEIEVLVDSNMIDAVVRNLLSNSVKFTEEGGTVVVSAQNEMDEHGEETWCRVRVTDNGIGMDSQVVENLFNLDAHHTTRGTNDEQGSGLGLVLCSEIVSMHGGRMRVYSLPNRGTSIEFTVPLAV